MPVTVVLRRKRKKAIVDYTKIPRETEENRGNRVTVNELLVKNSTRHLHTVKLLWTIFTGVNGGGADAPRKFVLLS